MHKTTCRTAGGAGSKKNLEPTSLDENYGPPTKEGEMHNCNTINKKEQRTQIKQPRKLRRTPADHSGNIGVAATDTDPDGSTHH